MSSPDGPYVLVNYTQRCLFAAEDDQTLRDLGADPYGILAVSLHLMAGEWLGDTLTLCRVSAAGEGLTDITHLLDAGRTDALRPVEGFSGRAPRVLVNLDRRERLDPPDLGDRPSLRGFVEGVAERGPGGVQGALAVLLAASGQADWGGAEVVGSWAGGRVGVLPVSDPSARVIGTSVSDEVGAVLVGAGVAAFEAAPDGGVVRRLPGGSSLH